MKIALFADLHGKILLPFKLVDLYQKSTGNKIDIILQCGDVGIYPNLENLDKATLKHAKYDRDELGFYDDFVFENQAVKAYLEELNLNMICVRGNHEDHNYLDELEAQHQDVGLFPVDVYKKVFICKTGKVQHFEVGNSTLSFVGIGRIGDRKNRNEKRFIQNYEKEEIKTLIDKNESYDILLTHDKDDSSIRGYGMKEIRTVLDNIIFHHHFHGHTGEPYNLEEDLNGITQTCKIKELEFDSNGRLSYGCMVILTKLEEEIFTLEAVKESLIHQLTKSNWKTFEG